MLYNNRTWNKVLGKTMNTGKWKVIEATIEQELYGTDELQAAGCTIAIDDMVKAAVKAAKAS